MALRKYLIKGEEISPYEENLRDWITFIEMEYCGEVLLDFPIILMKKGSSRDYCPFGKRTARAVLKSLKKELEKVLEKKKG